MRGRQRGSGYGKSQRARRVVVGLAFLVVASLLLVLFLGRWAQIDRLRHEIDKLNVAQQAALAEQEVLRERLARTDDSDVIEERARERLGLVKPGEEKVIFIEE